MIDEVDVRIWHDGQVSDVHDRRVEGDGVSGVQVVLHGADRRANQRFESREMVCAGKWLDGLHHLQVGRRVMTTHSTVCRRCGAYDPGYECQVVPVGVRLEWPDWTPWPTIGARA